MRLLRLARLACLTPALLLAALGCGTQGAAPTAVPEGPQDGLPASCNPLRTSGACLLPFPSAIFLDDDPSTPTGQRVHLAAEQFPKNELGTPYDPARLNVADGFSPSGEILAYFEERLDPASLPPLSDPKQSLAPASATVIVDLATGARVAHFAEVDAEVSSDSDRQALILRPMARLASGRRYAVAITHAVRTLAGGAPPSPPGWAAIAAGTATDPLAAKQAQRMPAIFAALAKAGVAQDTVLLAWDFVTASEAGLVRSMRSMRDQTVAVLASKTLTYKVESVENDFSLHALRRVRGTFQVPRFLSQTDPTVAKATLTFDANGLPVQSGTYDAPFTLMLPRAAQNGPVRLLVYGHGFLGTGEGELGDATGSYVQDFIDAKGYAVIATDWVGFSRYEGIAGGGNGAAASAVSDLNDVPWITDRLHQALVNAMTLAVTGRDGLAHDPALLVGGKPSIDGSRVDYFGISLGGVMGSALMGWSPDLERGVLNVGAAGWTTLFQRSTNWSLFKLVVGGTYPDKLDQQVLLDVLQAHLDPVDGMSIAPHVLVDPLPGNTPHRVLLQMAVNDVQVSNVAAEMYARTVGLPLLADAPLTPYALPLTKGPLPSALTAWDLHEMPPPVTNVPADVLSGNMVHTELRALPEVETQIDRFLRTAEVVSLCPHTCSPE